MMNQRAVTTDCQPGQMPINHLPDDALFSIFLRCDVKTLGRLALVCKRFNKLLQSDTVWLSHCKKYTLIHNAYSSTPPRKIKLKEQCRISLNWIKGTYRERTLLRHNPKQLPWMQYADQTLWISNINIIKCYKVKVSGSVEEVVSRRCVLHQEPGVRVSYTTMPDVSRFVVKDNLIVSGCRDGSLHVFDCQTGRNLVKFTNVHRTDTQTVDFHGESIITGSVDKTVKVLSNAFCNDSSQVQHHSIDIGDRVWCVGMDPCGRSFAVGTAGCYGESSLSLWDIDRSQRVLTLGDFRFGAGVLDLKYENPNSLLSCGYDSCLRMWDTRTGNCVLEWEEPFDSTLFCLQSDNDLSVVTGTARYGMVRLWDKRSTTPVQMNNDSSVITGTARYDTVRLWDKRSTTPVQGYYLGPKNSPVYSIAFDSSRLYAALDLCMIMADFSILPP